MEKLLFVAIDVDDKKYHGYAVTVDQEEGFGFHSKPNAAALIKRLEKFTGSGYKFKICYESTYLGFSLCRDLRAKGYDCEVIATSVVPEVASKRVKTDRVDAKKLAIYYSKGMLTATIRYRTGTSKKYGERNPLHRFPRFNVHEPKHSTRTKTQRSFNNRFAPYVNWIKN